jgi:parvulin-like peptidyl-prolyl isomerase
MGTRPVRRLPALIAVALVATALAAADEGARSVVDGREVLARVNGEPVTAEDLRWQIGTLHEGMTETEGMVERPDPLALLQRVIDAKLIVQEARNIGLDELPEVDSTLEMGRKELLKRLLIDERIKEIHEGDPAAVEDLYVQIVQEVRVRSVLFQTREDATAFASAVRGETSFEQALASFVESGKAVTKGEEYLRVREMRPEVAAAVVALEPGSVTAPLDVPGGVAVIRLLDVRVPEDAEARAAAEETALTYRRQAALLDYTEEMRQRYVKVDEEVRDSLDFDSDESDLETYRNDDRILAEVKGAEPVTVSELTRRVEQVFYHGLDRAAERKRINDKLPGVLDRIVLERAMESEAKRLGIEDGPAFRSARKAQEESILFGTFVRRVVNPEIQLSDEKLEALYAEHLDDYSTPAMIRLQGLPFKDREHAEAGLEKLRQGSDLKWMRANAGGLVDEPDEGEELLAFDGRLVTLASLPPGIQDAVVGASAGDFRLYAQPDGAFYVLAVVEVFPSRPREFAEVRDQLLQRAFLLEREKAIDVWTDELRKASEIEVRADAAQLGAIVGLGPAEGK